MIKQYISDIITEDEICQWLPGDRILIESQTGSGKSEFIKKNLYNYCAKNNKMILLMSNRNLLKNQNMEDLGDKTKYIRAHNYQEYESRILGGFDIFALFESFDYIVYDEAHYFFSDSAFNKNTDLLLNPIKNTPKDKILILITATPQALLDYQPDYKFRYQLPHDYSYIKNIYFYNRPKHTLPIIESIIKTIPKNEKILYFGSEAEDNYRISKVIEDSSFICSNSNKMFDKSNQDTIYQIVHESKFNCRALFSTKLLDNGVNIKDNALKHIFIDLSDPISFIQCLGRKRILNDNDGINLYVNNYNLGILHFMKKGYEKKLEAADNFKKGDLSRFKDLDDIQRKTGNLINKYYGVNEAKYQNYKTQRRMLEEIILDFSPTRYKKYICELLNFDFEKIHNANMVYEKSSIADLLEKYVGIKMFNDDIEAFKQLFFSNVFSPKKTDYSARGMRAANGIMQEDNLNFKISSRRETGGVHRRETYWIVEKNKENE